MYVSRYIGIYCSYVCSYAYIQLLLFKYIGTVVRLLWMSELITCEKFSTGAVRMEPGNLF